MIEGGLALNDISFRINVPLPTLYRWRTRFRNQGKVEGILGSGRQAGTFLKSDWRLVRLSRQNPFASSSQLQVEWSSRTSFQSYRTAQLLGPPQQAWLLQEDNSIYSSSLYNRSTIPKDRLTSKECGPQSE